MRKVVRKRSEFSVSDPKQGGAFNRKIRLSASSSPLSLPPLNTIACSSLGRTLGTSSPLINPLNLHSLERPRWNGAMTMRYDTMPIQDGVEEKVEGCRAYSRQNGGERNKRWLLT
jgi:hypothetical protein